MVDLGRYAREADISNPMCIPVHDRLVNEIVAGNIVKTDYYNKDILVATIVMTYEGAVLETKTRTL
jgi:hypothetical protein